MDPFGLFASNLIRKALDIVLFAYISTISPQLADCWKGSGWPTEDFHHKSDPQPQQVLNSRYDLAWSSSVLVHNTVQRFFSSTK